MIRFVALFGLIVSSVVAPQVLAKDENQVTEESLAPYLVVLGVAQDAGYPQAGCFKAHCIDGWEDPLKRRSATSLGLVLPNNKTSYMFEASPNFPEQFYTLHKHAPVDEYTFSGIFITHAHIGHYAGLMHLGKEAMGAERVPVFAMPKMAQFLRQNGPWSQLVALKNIDIFPIRHAESIDLESVAVTPLLVPHRDEYAETVAYQIRGPSKSAVFIPDINKWQEWEQSLVAVVEQNDYVLIDATFFANGELPGRDMSKIPHPFVVESMQILDGLTPIEKAKVWFIHINHTNPILDNKSDEYKQVIRKGFNVAYENLELML